MIKSIKNLFSKDSKEPEFHISFHWSNKESTGFGNTTYIGQIDGCNTLREIEAQVAKNLGKESKVSVLAFSKV